MNINNADGESSSSTSRSPPWTQGPPTTLHRPQEKPRALTVCRRHCRRPPRPHSPPPPPSLWVPGTLALLLSLRTAPLVPPQGFELPASPPEKRSPCLHLIECHCQNVTTAMLWTRLGVQVPGSAPLSLIGRTRPEQIEQLCIQIAPAALPAANTGENPGGRSTGK